MKQVLTSLFLLFSMIAVAQEERHVLFIGNSYTHVNNLPEMVANMAESMGNHLIYNQNTPGGCSFQQHCTNASMTLICQGGWDAVVLQEQSQKPSFLQHQVESDVYPYAKQLVDSIYKHNPCAEPMFYMTWGRKNGDPQNAQYFPVLATYEGMDSMLCERYTYMAETYDASLCPVGRVWRYLRKNNPEIELYSSDGSHPSTAGTYAAACAFYVMLFQENPDSITFSATLNPDNALTIRKAVKSVVFNSLSEWKRTLPQAFFTLNTHGYEVTVSSQSLHADSLLWDFGDGSIAETGDSILHYYADSGVYSIRLIASRHCMSDTCIRTIQLSRHEDNPTAIGTAKQQTPQLFPNPVSRAATLILPNNQSLTTITLYSTDGRKIWGHSTDTIQHTLDLHTLAPGVYYIKIDQSNSSTIQRIIKN